MDRGLLFLRTLDDLEQRTIGTDAYIATKAAGLLRLLLMDGQPLVHQVNRGHGLKLTFEVADHDRYNALIMEDQPLMSLVMDGLFPPTSRPGYTLRRLNLAQWLGFQVGAYRADPFSVGDVIRYLSHVAGGVHAGSPKVGTDESLSAVANVLSVNEMSGVARTMRGITSVTVVGLETLRETVRGDS